MRHFLKTKKSNGIPVTVDIHRIIATGNAARDAARWDDARIAYQEAVARAPDLAHIWVQLGHAETRLRQFDRAEAAYLRALAISPDLTDPLIHLGHARKELGDVEGSARYYLQAARQDANQPEATHELQAMLARIVPAKRRDLRMLLSLDLDANSPTQDLYLDLTIAVTAALLGRPFSAIEREQAGRLLAILDQPVPVQPCAYVEGRPEWVALSMADARRAIALGLDASMPLASRERQSATQEIAMIFAPPAALTAETRLMTVRDCAAATGHAYFLDQAAQAGARLIEIGQAEDPAETVARARTRDTAPTRAASPGLALSGTMFGLGTGKRGLGFRHGLGWLAPRTWGSWTHARGAELVLPIGPGEGTVRLSLLLRGLPSSSAGFRLVPIEGEPVSATVPADEERWVLMDLPRPADGVLRVFVKGDQAVPVNEQPQKRPVLASIGVAGFHLCASADQAARAALLEGIALNDLSWS